MTIENKEIVFDVRKPLAPKPKVEVPKALNECEPSEPQFSVSVVPKASEGCARFPNGVRPMIRFVPGNQDTTEARLKNAREVMTFTRAKKTIRRSGWYFTEPYAPCDSAISVIRQIKEVFGV